MPDQKITALPAGGVADNTILPVVNGATTQRVTVKQVADHIGKTPGPQGPAGPAGTPGKDADLKVFEQGAAPAGVVLKNGYLWIKPGNGTDVVDPSTVIDAPTAPEATASDPTVTSSKGITMEDVDREIDNALSDPSSKTLSELKQTIIDAVLSKLNGGPVTVPDYEWTLCRTVAGAGDVYACIRGGRLYLRGSVTITTSTFTHVRTLPASFPAPKTRSASVCVGGQSGVAERLVSVFINTDRTIHVSTLGLKITDFDLGGATCLMS